MAARLALVIGMAACFFGLMATPATSNTVVREDEDYDRELEARMHNAIGRGVAYLRTTQNDDGWWKYTDGGSTDQNVGATALCALALIFAKVDVSDDAVQSAVRLVRTHAPNLTYTYSIALSLALLDRVNSGRDTPLIKQLAAKVLSGQSQQNAGWTYFCPHQGGLGDNSNTQLAMLALFIARKHDVDVAAALKACERRFRTSQMGGAWGYHNDPGSPLNAGSPAMTCAGLMALAFNFVVQRNAVLQGAGTDIENLEPSKIESLRKLIDPRDDPQVKAALLFLRDFMLSNQHHGEHFTYFLWTMERTCLIYDWKKIMGINWHYWGAKLLLPKQQANGCWAQDTTSGRNCETAFAILFLSKADLLGNLFDFAILTGGSLKGTGKKEPATQPRVPQPKAKPGREGNPREAAALQEELRTAIGDRVDEILDLLEKTRGGDYTTALVNALGFARAEVKTLVREALTRRLTRMNAKTLRDYLTHDEPGCRRAAAHAIVQKNDKETSKELTPDLIFMLRDKVPDVKEEAYQTLKTITGKDFGRDAKAWDKWWQSQMK
jgi:hypothetical protein